MALMVVWWVTEPVPVAATALLPLVSLPLLDVLPAREAAAPYADPVLFLFIGGFMIAIAVERWNLHARAALLIASAVGASPHRLVAGFVLGAGLISMWISNTATALMLTPIAVGVAAAMARGGQVDRKLGAALVLGVAYAASLGGMATPVGSPTNVIAMGFLERQQVQISFTQWMSLGVPVMAVMLPVLWFIVTRGLKPVSREAADAAGQVVRGALKDLGPMTVPEWRVLAVFLAVALAWMTRELLVQVPGLGRLTDTGIALIGTLALFLIPAGDHTGRQLLDWPSAERIPWGIVLLFGGGLSMAGAMDATGLSGWLATQMEGLGGLPPVLVILALLVLTVVVTELMSNVATLTGLLPILGALAVALGVNPLFLAFPVCLAASLGFMLPIATAPNAVAYATGLPGTRTMLRVGFLLNAAGVIVILAVTQALGPLVLGG
jgi:sodium-dependent dicarboxylate transporter 2/3/5